MIFESVTLIFKQKLLWGKGGGFLEKSPPNPFFKPPAARNLFEKVLTEDPVSGLPKTFGQGKHSEDFFARQFHQHQIINKSK